MNQLIDHVLSGGTSRVTGDGHARFCEGLGVKVPGATRRGGQLASLPRPSLVGHPLTTSYRRDMGVFV